MTCCSSPSLLVALLGTQLQARLPWVQSLVVLSELQEGFPCALQVQALLHTGNLSANLHFSLNGGAISAVADALFSSAGGWVTNNLPLVVLLFAGSVHLHGGLPFIHFSIARGAEQESLPLPSHAQNFLQGTYAAPGGHRRTFGAASFSTFDSFTPLTTEVANDFALVVVVFCSTHLQGGLASMQFCRAYLILHRTLPLLQSHHL